MNKGPECTKCGTEDPNYDVITCNECRDKALCCECATGVQRDLEVCSDDCAQTAIARLKSELIAARKAAAEMARALSRIRSLDPAVEGGYPQTVGAAKGEAILGLSFVPNSNEKKAA